MARRKRRCRECKEWFEPNPRTLLRQHTCGNEQCQKERHRKACAAWRRRNASEEREERVRQRARRVIKEETESSAGERRDEIDWNMVRDEIGVEVSVVIQEIVQYVSRRLRDEMSVQVIGSKGKSARYAPKEERDEIGRIRAGP